MFIRKLEKQAPASPRLVRLIPPSKKFVGWKLLAGAFFWLSVQGEGVATSFTDAQAGSLVGPVIRSSHAWPALAGIRGTRLQALVKQGEGALPTPTHS